VGISLGLGDKNKMKLEERISLGLGDRNKVRLGEKINLGLGDRTDEFTRKGQLEIRR
jgi:hypothetical protein